jgi:hypothetical protein
MATQPPLRALSASSFFLGGMIACARTKGRLTDDGAVRLISRVGHFLVALHGVFNQVAHSRDRADNPDIAITPAAQLFMHRPDQEGHAPSASRSELFRRDRRAAVASRHPHTRRWRQYTDNICKDIDVKRALSQRQDGLCEFCRGPFVFGHLEDAVVHHLSYDHECTYKGRSNIFEAPKCGECLRKFEQDATACLQWLRLLHVECHKTLHKAEARDPQWKDSVGLGSPD